MNAQKGSVPSQRRTPEEDAALWRRYRGALGEPANPSASQWLKAITTPAADYDWSIFRHPGPADASKGADLLAGTWIIGAERFEAGATALPWQIEGASLHVQDRVHRFDWLVHLSGQGDAGAARARELCDAWIKDHGQFNPFSWRAGPTADRVWNWMRCGALLFADPSGPEHRERIQALRRQALHLDALVKTSPDIDARFRQACIATTLCALARDTDGLAETLVRLDAEVSAQILPDGGHVSRSPERLLLAMLDLLAVRDALRRTGLGEPESLTRFLPRMGAMLNFLRCGDGRLMPFNDGGEASAEEIDAALGQLDTPPRKFSFSPKSGFQKLERGSLLLVLDYGAGPDHPFGDNAHAGGLGFELSDGPARIVTSCGFSRDIDIDLQAAVRRTGAHSTLVLGGRDSAAFIENDMTGLLMPVGPEGISAKRLEEANEIWLDAQHSGYRDIYGLLHRRRLFMAGDGGRLAGEDSLVRPLSRSGMEDDRPIGFDIRFHLHPSVSPEVTRADILLACDSGGRWRFKCSHAGVRLEKSAYFARGSVEHHLQIVISGRADPNGDGTRPPNCVRWAFVRDQGA